MTFVEKISPRIQPDELNHKEEPKKPTNIEEGGLIASSALYSNLEILLKSSRFLKNISDEEKEKAKEQVIERSKQVQKAKIKSPSTKELSESEKEFAKSMEKVISSPENVPDWLKHINMDLMFAPEDGPRNIQNLQNLCYINSFFQTFAAMFKYLNIQEFIKEYPSDEFFRLVLYVIKEIHKGRIKPSISGKAIQTVYIRKLRRDCIQEC